MDIIWNLQFRDARGTPANEPLLLELLLSPIARNDRFVETMRTQFYRRRHSAANPKMISDEYFEALVQEYYEPLYRFALNLTRSESDASDLTQHTFYVWSRKGHQLRDPSKVKTWLFTTLNRAFLETRRRQVRFPHYELGSVADELPSISPDAARQSDSSQVRAALSKVDEKFRAAVALFYLEDRPYKDIANILGVPIGTVKSRIARGLAQLREILQPDDVPASSSTRTGEHESEATESRETSTHAPEISQSTAPLFGVGLGQAMLAAG